MRQSAVDGGRKDVVGRKLVLRILSPHMARKPGEGSEPDPTLPERLGPCRPLDSRGGPNMILAPLRGISGEIEEQVFVGVQGESPSSADGKVGVDRFRQHGLTPNGHGCAIFRNESTSTFA